MPSTINLRNPGRPIHVAVILTNSTTEILDIAPVDIFTALSKYIAEFMPPGLLSEDQRKQALDFEIHWVTEHGQDASITAGGTIKATHSFETCPPLDITLIGAHGPSYTMTPGEIAFVQKCHQEVAAQLFICGGMITALQAGILEGKTATAPRPMVENLRKQAPGVNWVTKRWAHDGKLWTSGTLLNGQDMMRAFVLEIWGGDGTLADWMVKFGGWPVRDVDYKDVEWDF